MFCILEIQTNGTSMTFLPIIKKDTIEEAESVYHQILAAAAISSVEVHTAIIFNKFGQVIKKECYLHSEEAKEEFGE